MRREMKQEQDARAFHQLKKVEDDAVELRLRASEINEVHFFLLVREQCEHFGRFGTPERITNYETIYYTSFEYSNGIAKVLFVFLRVRWEGYT